MKHTPELIQPQLPFDEVHFIALGKKSIDITGQTFGRLTALGPVGKNKQRNILWLCRCDCGNTATVQSQRIRSGNTQSCGCLLRETRHLSTRTHGMSHSPLHRIWKGMIQRCTNPKEKSYKIYGGRGITICDEWRHNFQAFHDHVSKLPHCGEKGYTLDRIDNDGNYKPGNVRFATPTEQNRNVRSNVLITYNGKTQCLMAWAIELGINQPTLTKRIKKGWTVERAFTRKARNPIHAV